MYNEPTVSKNDDLEWSRILRRIYTMRKTVYIPWAILDPLLKIIKGVEGEENKVAVLVKVRSTWGIHKTQLGVFKLRAAALSSLFNEMAEPSWQEQLRLRLAERNNRESAFSSIIEQCKLDFYLQLINLIWEDRRLAQQTKLLKERNSTLLRAVGSVKGNPGSTTSSGEEWVAISCGLIYAYRCQHSNPVRVAYVASLETQISSLRDELANLYKTQGQNAQRLLSMNETLREKEELSRIDCENLRKAKDEIAALRAKVGQHAELMAEKDRTIQVSWSRQF